MTLRDLVFMLLGAGLTIVIIVIAAFLVRDRKHPNDDIATTNRRGKQ